MGKGNAGSLSLAGGQPDGAFDAKTPATRRSKAPSLRVGSSRAAMQVAAARSATTKAGPYLLQGGNGYERLNKVGNTKHETWSFTGEWRPCRKRPYKT